MHEQSENANKHIEMVKKKEPKINSGPVEKYN